MWTRRELKERAKAALHRNYWKLVLVSALLLLLGCEAGGYNFSGGVWKNSNSNGSVERAESVTENGSVVDGAAGAHGTDESVPQAIGRSEAEPDDINVRIDGIVDDVVVGVIAVIVFLIVFFIFLAVILAVDIFLINPFDVGGKRFMRKSIEDVAQVKEITFAYDHSYKNVVKVMFYKELYIFLWALLFIIPGIVKMYQYLMVPYLLSEYPDMEYHEALARSRDMMEGNKWRAFVLGLSFILWDFLGTLTFGIVEIFYVNPYRNLTFAALYDELKRTPVMNVQQ
ncbi:MAG: DUF975 family protein [Lachnospiraceae bacterium]|nr:DUF975 family protein [Lachnospiraceae bacterium]